MWQGLFATRSLRSLDAHRRFALPTLAKQKMSPVGEKSYVILFLEAMKPSFDQVGRMKCPPPPAGSSCPVIDRRAKSEALREDWSVWACRGVASRVDRSVAKYHFYLCKGFPLYLHKNQFKLFS